MKNLAMERKLCTGQAVDLSSFPLTSDGDYVLDYATGGKAENGDCQGMDFDFCDSKKEVWIGSIGQVMGDQAVLTMADGTKRTIAKGAYVASTSGKFYQAEEQGWRCVWLR